MPSTNERNAAIAALKEGSLIAGNPTNDQLLGIVDHVLKAAEEQRAADAPNPLMTFMHLWSTNKEDIDAILAKVGGLPGIISLIPSIVHIMKTATAQPDHAAALKSMVEAASVGGSGSA